MSEQATDSELNIMHHIQAIALIFVTNCLACSHEDSSRLELCVPFHSTAPETAAARTTGATLTSPDPPTPTHIIHAYHSPATAGHSQALDSPPAPLSALLAALFTAAAALFRDTCLHACLMLCHLLCVSQAQAPPHAALSSPLPAPTAKSPRTQRAAPAGGTHGSTNTFLVPRQARSASPAPKRVPSSLSSVDSATAEDPGPIGAPRSHPILDLIECGTSDSTLMHTSATSSNPTRRSRIYPPVDFSRRASAGRPLPPRSNANAAAAAAARPDATSVSGGSARSSVSAPHRRRGSAAEDGYASAAEQTVASVRESVATAVVSLQGQLRKDLQEDELQIFSVLGRGGYGIVYHGPYPLPRGPRTLFAWMSSALFLSYSFVYSFVPLSFMQ